VERGILNQAAEFGPLPQNRAAEFLRRIPRNFTIFIRTTCFTENGLKVALLQVCLRWFLVWW